MRKLSALLLAAVLALLTAPTLALLTAPAVYAADNGTWSVFPASSGTSQRPYFYLAAGPGATLTDKVTVTNKTAAPLSFRLYGADAYNTERDGGFAVRTEKEKQSGVGAWAKPARSALTVPARSSLTVPFTLTVPPDAEPGDHVGALVALDDRVSAGQAGSGRVAVGVQQAVGARIYLRVGGPAVPALAVEHVSLAQHRPLVPGTGESRTDITYTLHNRGNVTLTPKVDLSATGLFGRTLLSRGLTKVPAELLPGQRVTLTETWHGSPQLDWGDVTLTASAKGAKDSAGASFLALPWLAAAVLLAAVLAFTAHRVLRRPSPRGWPGQSARRRLTSAGTRPR
ncbi:WxL protein peptidoglycan domain-containing protein [Streptomyces sp. NPDC048416]|uniref:WxL protein peptidoglycan domain-containing protein n=1 Tax=Streptomyces sp. NPDC048416 TaxID=3365546 RepID=UPI00370FD80B